MGEEIAARWFEQARRDLAAARDSVAAGHCEWACFQAQQAAEKMLKGYLLDAGRAHPVTHSVKTLIAECEKLRPAFREIRASAELDRHYVTTRYPDALPDDIPANHFDEEAADRCLSLASSVIEFVTRLSGS
jgi:HEPN domain-containing protein